MLDAPTLARKLGHLSIEYRRRLAKGLPRDDLLPEAQSLERLAGDLGVPDMIAVAKMRHADILLSLERWDEAEIVLGGARAVLKELRQHDLGVTILARLAELYGRQEQWEKTDEVCAEGIGRVEQVRYRISAAYMQSAYLRFRMALYAWGVRSAYALGNYEAMLGRAELSKSRAAVRAQVGRAGAAESEGQLEERFQRVCTRIDAARARGEVPASLLAERRVLWDLLCIQRYRSVRGEDLPAFSTGQVQALLDDDEAILYYYFVDRFTLLTVTLDRWRIIPELRVLEPEDRQQLEQDADYILGLVNPSRSAARLGTICERWHQLIPELEGVERLRRLIISPHGLLHSLPFHAMPDKWNPLIKRFAISYIPNLSSMLLTRAPASQRRVLVVGISDYDLPGEVVRPLPNAEPEVRTVAELYEASGVPVRALCGVEAREALIHELARTGRLADFSCLHLATHGINVPSDTPMESHLYAQDSHIDGFEIANWQLNAELIVLSACCSGQRPFRGRGMDTLPGDEMFGLQAAFFATGCRCLVSALWPVLDGVAPPIMEGLHRHLIAGAAPEVALQRAMLEFLAENRGKRDRIFYWAPLFLVTMGRSAPSPSN